jgi:hypothetical protein
MAKEKHLNPMALSADQAAKTLRVPPEWVRSDIDAGAPTNADGTLNLVHYAAWLNLAAKEERDGTA